MGWYYLIENKSETTSNETQRYALAKHKMHGNGAVQISHS